MILEKQSPCKVNLLLNILGKRADGFHELETVMHPIDLCDELVLRTGRQGVQLTCSNPELPKDSGNLVFRAATAFRETAGIREGVQIHLEKRIPLAAGLGGGSSNAATTLLGLNELFGKILTAEQLHQIASLLGSDVPFFLHTKPALATGRGEKVQPLDFFPALKGAGILLVHPGFGIATAWAYQQLARFPTAMQGKPGRAEKLISLLQKRNLSAAAPEFYNALEAPALKKYPWLGICQDFLRSEGAAATLMSGSGSTTFAITRSKTAGHDLEEKVKRRFGQCWTAVTTMPG